MAEPSRTLSTTTASNTGKVLQHEGWLYKLGGFIKNWKKRWFVIRKGELMYFEEKSQVNQRHSAKGAIVLRGSRAMAFSAKEHKEFAFGIRPQGTDRTYVMVADTSDERRTWLTLIAQIAGQSDEIEDVLDGKVVPDSMREGYLLKQGGLFGSWKIRYFIITATAHLLYFEDKTAVTTGQSGWSVSLVGATITAEPESFVERKYAVSIVPRADGRKYIMVAGDDEEFDAWFNTLQVAASGPPSATAAAVAASRRGSATVPAKGTPVGGAPSPSASSTSSMPKVIESKSSSEDDSEGSDTEDENERVKASGGKGSAAAIARDRRKKREQDSDDDDEPKQKGSKSKSSSTAGATLAAPTAKHGRQGSGGTPAPPTVAAVAAVPVVAGIPLTDGRLWRYDENEDDDDHMWKQRYFVFNPRSMTLSYWHHKRHMMTQKPTRVHELVGATLAMDATKCDKAREPGCVFSLTCAAKKKGGKGKKWLFASASRKNLAVWWSSLTNAFAAAAAAPPPPPAVATPPATVAQPRAAQPAAAAAPSLPSFAASPSSAASSAPPPAHAAATPYFSPVSLTTKLAPDLQKYKEKIIANPASLAPIEVQMLAAVKGNLDIFVGFRGASVAFSRDRMTHHEYFAAFFEAFGVADGMSLWEGLLEVLPDPAKVTALQRLMIDNKAFLISTLTSPPPSAPIPAATAAATNDGSDDDYDDDEEEASKAPTAATAAVAIPSQPAIKKPTTAKPKFEDELRRRQEKKAAAASTGVPPTGGRTESKGATSSGGSGEAARRVASWVEETGTLATMLSTLDVIFPGIPKGMFDASPMADFPSLKKIYARTLPRIHPDKQSSSTPEQQQLSPLVYAALSAAFERANRKHLKAIAGGGAARSPPTPSR